MLSFGEIGGMKGKRRTTLLRFIAVPVVLLLCFAFTYDPPSSPFELRGVQGDGVPRSDPEFLLLGTRAESPVQALVDAIRNVTAAAGWRNADARFSHPDAEVFLLFQELNVCVLQHR